MSSRNMELPTLNHSSTDSLAFQYHGVDVHNHSRSQGLILATSEQDARLLLRTQSIVALKLSLVSAANPLLTAQSASAHTLGPTWHWLAPWVKAKHNAWREQTLALLATALDQAPLLQALAIVERQLIALKAPALWPAAVLVWRDGLAKGSSCYEALQSFPSVWGSDWLAWVHAAEAQGIPLAPLTPWVQTHQQRQQLHKVLRPLIIRCYGWGIALLILALVATTKNPVQAATAGLNILGVALPIGLISRWVIFGLKKRLGNNLKNPFNHSATESLRKGWIAWWMALNLYATEAEKISPLEALQMAVQIPSAHDATFLHHTLAAIEAGQPLESALNQSPHLPMLDRLRFEAVQDSGGLRHAIESCWHQAEATAQERQLYWWTGLDIVLTLISLGFTIRLVTTL